MSLSLSSSSSAFLLFYLRCYYDQLIIVIGGTSQDDLAYACMTRALELGINFFDNAEAYGNGNSEICMGKIFQRWFSQGILFILRNVFCDTDVKFDVLRLLIIGIHVMLVIIHSAPIIIQHHLQVSASVQTLLCPPSSSAAWVLPGSEVTPTPWAAPASTCWRVWMQACNDCSCHMWICCSATVQVR